MAEITSGNGSAGPRRCLVIEDNVDAAESLGMLLELIGHQAEVEGSRAPRGPIGHPSDR